MLPGKYKIKNVFATNTKEDLNKKEQLQRIHTLNILLSGPQSSKIVVLFETS